MKFIFFFFFFQAEDGIRDKLVTGVQTCALPISCPPSLAGLGVAALQVREAGVDGPVDADPEAIGSRPVTRAGLAVVAGGGGKTAPGTLVHPRAARPPDAHPPAGVR